ncbi:MULTISPECIES: MnhB domain-containing protein [Methanobrevibacter]|uniref:Membrane-bound hydrogenase subunit ehbI n=1 Tax=Methanobrevibacter gottschalkii DSM 11977 TaxID=1122229 RepID=A0A3N5B6G0_9EURY|nr:MULTISPECIES: MnhB domain-containing protein [Methanobrevibacter]OEC93832.1 cation:proton antiporter [Methanobrevibacter sp. A27]RPF52669.1 membrane-bound hydrogenase subunit ehbI [Methanobrevibacter gottschalkii DSM 11977]
MSQSSIILKLVSLPISMILICLGIMTILGGHITPGGGFQGGAMIAGGVILSVLVYGLDNSPLEFSHLYIEVLESIGALGFIILGLIGLFVSGFFLYNVGTDLLNVVPPTIQNVLHYPDVTNAGIIPYLNIFVGLKVFVGLSAIVIAFAGFKKITEESK